MANKIMRPRSEVVLHMMVPVVEEEWEANEGFAKAAIRCVF